MTNYDLDTEEGMQNAVNWFRTLAGTLSDGGFWGVPRSGSTYQIFHNPPRMVCTGQETPDPGIRKVAEAAGYLYEENIK